MTTNIISDMPRWFVVVSFCGELEMVVLLPVYGSETNTIAHLYNTHRKYTGMSVYCWVKNLQWFAVKYGMC